MSDIERILLECRYFLSLNKNYLDIANYLHIDESIVYNDLNYRLLKIDRLLYNRVLEKIKKNNN